MPCLPRRCELTPRATSSRLFTSALHSVAFLSPTTGSRRKLIVERDKFCLELLRKPVVGSIVELQPHAFRQRERFREHHSCFDNCHTSYELMRGQQHLNSSVSELLWHRPALKGRG